jgi:hypothetical protein
MCLTPLHIAAAMGSVDLVQVTLVNNYTQFALHFIWDVKFMCLCNAVLHRCAAVTGVPR